MALLAADRAGVSGPTVLNGAPLSYRGGEAGINPMSPAPWTPAAPCSTTGAASVMRPLKTCLRCCSRLAHDRCGAATAERRHSSCLR
ncbi:MAG: hypothetical protein C0505_11375 [Leptothrix sp. (in: Bacteria)]|nr:hypothetical protein [Leptothrix sp. (in: b-proteobacteria)]